MASDAQIQANQENAKKSTGPKTVEGKRRSSMNAMTHGIFAQIPILPGEIENYSMQSQMVSIKLTSLEMPWRSY